MPSDLSVHALKVVCFSAYSGAGKTTLVEALVSLLVASGARVAVIKHAHHAFDVDTPGKDSWRHRKAGAREVLVVSDRRLALMREFEPDQPEPSLGELIARIDPSTDWLLVEGFRASTLPKIEVWRAPAADFAGHPTRYPEDAAVVAVAVDDPTRLPVPTALPLLDLNQPLQVLDWMQAHAELWTWKGAQASSESYPSTA
jgi:molybdopterin-guanine dinucleotide biosynthesis protein B